MVPSTECRMRLLKHFQTIKCSNNYAWLTIWNALVAFFAIKRKKRENMKELIGRIMYINIFDVNDDTHLVFHLTIIVDENDPKINEINEIQWEHKWKNRSNTTCQWNETPNTFIYLCPIVKMNSLRTMVTNSVEMQTKIQTRNKPNTTNTKPQVIKH